jgi:hypothetical protein
MRSRLSSSEYGLLVEKLKAINPDVQTDAQARKRLSRRVVSD